MSLDTSELMADSSVQAGDSMLTPGLWRGEIDLSVNHKVTFLIEVAHCDGVLEVHYLNGAERMPVEKIVHAKQNSLELLFPSYQSGVEAQIVSGEMTGQARWYKPDRTYEFAFRASQIDSAQELQRKQHDYAQIDGLWSIELDYDGSGDPLTAMAEFKQTESAIKASIETPYGDFRFLTGEIHQKKFSLAVFDGGHIMSFSGKINDDGSLEGEAATSAGSMLIWTGNRAQQYALPDITAAAGMKAPSQRLQLELPNLDGKTVSLDDAVYKDKVVIITLAGSWCPTCHDQASFLIPLYREFHARGLEAINVMFEFSEDFETVKPRLDAFKKRYQIPFEMVFAGHCSPELRMKSFPQLKTINAFPTALIIGRNGLVNEVIPSFKGPATGVRHQDFVRDFRARIEEQLG